MFAKCFGCCKKNVDTKVEDADTEVQKLNLKNTLFKVDERFSINIYEEMPIEDLKREYQKTLADQQSYMDDIKTGILTESPSVSYVLKRLEENLSMINSLLDSYAQEARLTPDQATTTLERFDALFDRHKTDPRHRMKSLYCYDVRESETFKATFKAEVAMREILSRQVAENEDMKDLTV